MTEPEEYQYDPDAILADPDAHPIHKVYAAINIRVRDHGEAWAKCMNCAFPYQVVDGLSQYFCSDSCEREYRSELGL